MSGAKVMVTFCVFILDIFSNASNLLLILDVVCGTPEQHCLCEKNKIPLRISA